jgi:hypothetical protein
MIAMISRFDADVKERTEEMRLRGSKLAPNLAFQPKVINVGCFIGTPGVIGCSYHCATNRLPELRGTIMVKWSWEYYRFP